MKKELSMLMEAMKKHNIDIYVIPMNDEHFSEYICSHYKFLEYVSGFTGSAGTLLVSDIFCGLWTDGRYFIQAEKELDGSGITLMKEKEPHVPSVSEKIESLIEEKLEKGCLKPVIGFDGKCVSSVFAEKYSCITDIDLADEIWKNRPERPSEPLYIVDTKYCGLHASEKIKKLRDELFTENAFCMLISTLDDIAWILNLRGNDIPYNPLFYSHLIIRKDSVTLYTDRSHIDSGISDYLASLGVDVKPYLSVLKELSMLSGTKILSEKDKMSYSLFSAVPEDTEITDHIPVCVEMKAKKNITECESLKKVHINDGIAVTNFIYEFKKNLEKHIKMTETDCVQRVHELRCKQPGFISESFKTISAYGENAAIVHYSPARSGNALIKNEGLFLIDSGAQYMGGTTDITRTISCGRLSPEEKKGYTLTVIGNLRLASLIFPEGTSGNTLDLAAREEFWKLGLDYKHGTGHGVGFMLCVHERPVAIRSSSSVPVFYEGYFVSDEPGIYIEKNYGARSENLMMCVKDTKNPGFLKFETYTMCPFDRDALDISLMTSDDIRLWNEYHEKVYNTLSPFLSQDVNEWIKKNFI